MVKVATSTLTCRLTRENIVTLLGGACIQCYDSESTQTLEQALRVNIDDGTIPYDTVYDLLRTQAGSDGRIVGR